ncbi:hypothetical protein [Bordetella sp. N]|uniref:hypothetical protein n=1 Tax=Bordetella sp. N TaxID=1746199 RepID=UPI0018D1FCF9|nr:hypothetical protein [Bordetella sp. N]
MNAPDASAAMGNAPPAVNNAIKPFLPEPMFNTSITLNVAIGIGETGDIHARPAGVEPPANY